MLIAAFRYLRELGAAWVRPLDGEYLPQCNVRDRAVTVKEAPSSRHRGMCIEGIVSEEHVLGMIDWLPRVGMNGYFNQFWVPVTFYDRWYNRDLAPEDKIGRLDVEGIRDTTVYAIKKRGLLYHVTGHGWTCEPFGIEGTAWDDSKEYSVSEEARACFALLNGERKLFKNVPILTNLCYSQPKVRAMISKSVADYCEAVPQVDYLHVWLADDCNNHCECDECSKKRPSDWYIILLNEIDACLTQRGINTKIVFLMYNDLFWPPEQNQLHNPERFVLMFAPITRTYTHSLGEAGDYDESLLPDFVRNKCKMPSSVEENLCWLKQWQKQFRGDSFDFDYHYMWDHHRDVAHMSMNRVLFQDMKALGKLGLNGMVSCQNQRAWIPSGFGICAMAQALWNSEADYDETADRYFADAFGTDGAAARKYLEELSELFNPRYMRGEIDAVSAEVAQSAGKIPVLVASFKNTIRKNMQSDLPYVQRRSWEYLDYHADYCVLLAAAVKNRAEGNSEQAKKSFEIFKDHLQKNEAHYIDVLDIPTMLWTLESMFVNK